MKEQMLGIRWRKVLNDLLYIVSFPIIMVVILVAMIFYIVKIIGTLVDDLVKGFLGDSDDE